MLIKEIREMIEKVKSFNKNITEDNEKKQFLGYHSSRIDLKDGWYKGDLLDENIYEDLIRDIYGEFFDYDQNVEDNNTKKMNAKFKKNKYGFTFITKYPIESTPYQTTKYKYGDYLYKVYGHGNEILIDDQNELNAEIVVSSKPLYFEKIDYNFRKEYEEPIY